MNQKRLRQLPESSLIFKLLTACGVAVSLLSTASIAGDIEGFVSFSALSKPQQRALSPFARARAETSTQPKESPESSVVVYLSEHKNLQQGAIPNDHPKMDQRDLKIEPHILPVMVGTTVEFPNSDALYHNLFSLSPTRKFDLGRYPKGVSKQVTFNKVGEVHVFCDIHPTMSSIILVLPNRWFSYVARDGRFSLTNVPAGTYEIHAWHEQLHEVVATVTVPESGSTQIALEFGE